MTESTTANIATAAYAKPVIFGLLVVILGFGSFLAWTLYAPLAKGVVASGQVVVADKRKTIQHLEGGIIAAIHITEGQEVKAGQLLIELDDTRVKAERDLLQTRYFHSLAMLNRLDAERLAQDKVEFSEELLTREQDPSVNKILVSQINSFDARQTEISGQIDLLNQKIKQLEQKIKGLNAQKRSLAEQVRLVQQELKRTQAMYEKKLVELPRLIKQKKELVQIQGNISQIATEVTTTEVAINETRLELLQIKKNRAQEVSEQILEVQTQVLELKEKLITAEDKLTRTKIVAPQAGTILGLSTHTIGGVIPSAKAILEIVPPSERLLVEVKLKPIDIDNVMPNMMARVRFTAFKRKLTPTIAGKVEYISADALFDEAVQQNYYLARISIEPTEVAKLPDQDITPGMPVDVLIEAGERTAMEYLLAPLEEVIRKGMKED